MPKNKREGIFLSFIMSFFMIYIMAALNNDVKLGAFSASSWILALQRLPLGFLVGILCDLCICTPLSRKILKMILLPEDRELYQMLLLRFCMVVFMTIAMTIFGVLAGGSWGTLAIKEFFTYLPYNFTIALPIQMIIIAPVSLFLAQRLATFTAQILK